MTRLLALAVLLGAAPAVAQETAYLPTDVFVRLDGAAADRGAFGLDDAHRAVRFGTVGDEEGPASLVVFFAGVRDGQVVAVRSAEASGVVVREARPGPRTVRESGAGETFMRYPPPQGPWVDVAPTAYGGSGNDELYVSDGFVGGFGDVTEDEADRERVLEAARWASPASFEAGRPMLVVFGMSPDCEDGCRSEYVVFDIE